MTLLPLSQLLDCQRPPEHPVAVLGNRIYTQEAFQREVAAVAAQALAAGMGRWLLACPDAWGFLTGLFGLLQARCTVVIPPNYQPETLARLGAGAAGTLRQPERLPPGDAGPPGPIPDGTVEFWTSGSTGEAKRIAKTLSQLDAEVQVLEAAFGPRFQGGTVLGTVPHHHIYGCLFRILWPLAAGRTLALEPWGDPTRFQPLPAGGAPLALVSSPALLSRLPRLMDLDAVAPLAAVAFSSGGPLSAEDALAWRRWVPGGVVEIYGSTETGGIAWRIQTEAAEGDLWTPFADVVLAFGADGALQVASPRVGPEPLRLEDAAEPVPGGRFRLKGRLDRIVKLEEKRIALPELEACLAAHPWVQRAAVVPLEGPRASLGAVVVLTGEGRAVALAQRHRLVRGLQQHLAQRFEAVAIPKRWRILDELPFDDRGKLLPSALAALFATHAKKAAPMPTLPNILSHRSGAEEVFALDLDPGLLAFQGHFPGNPILPGVVQVDWAIRLGVIAFGPLGPFQGITQLKFLDLIHPGEALELHLTLDPDRRKLRFHFSAASGRKSTGVVVFGAAAE